MKTKITLLLPLLLLLPFFSMGQCNGNTHLDLYWTGGSGAFNAVSNWEVGALGSGVNPCQSPRSTDNVFFMAAAFAGQGAVDIRINSYSNCHNMFWDDAISMADRPRLISDALSTRVLDVYGSFELATNMDFAFSGVLRFVSPIVGIVPITTRGQKITVCNIQFKGEAGTTFMLQDDLYVDDPMESQHSGRKAGAIILAGGVFDLNSHDLRCDYFRSMNNNPTRGLNITSSTVNLYGSSTYGWELNFKAQTNNYTLFEAANSKIHSHTYSGFTWSKVFYGGVNMHYDTLVSDGPLDMHHGKSFFNHLFLNNTTSFTEDITIDVNELYLAPGMFYTFDKQQDTLIVDNINILPSCNEFITLETKIENGINTRGVVRKKTPGTLNTDRFILIDMTCDTRGGRSYTSTNSLKLGTTSMAWDVIAPTSHQDFYFRDNSGLQEWKNPNNWEIWNGTAFVANPNGCIPSPVDNVFFDHLSFPNSSKILQIDTTATCHNMTWLSSVSPNASISLHYPINSYGSIFFTSSMNTIQASSPWKFRGNAPDTIHTSGVKIAGLMTFKKYADYYIIGDNSSTTIDLETERIKASKKSTLRSNFVQIKLNKLYLYSRIMDSTQVYFNKNGDAFIDLGYNNLSYTGNTTFHFNGSNANGFVYVYAGTLPNVITNTYTYFKSGVSTVLGDMTLNTNTDWYPVNHPSSFAKLNLLGTMALYSGNMTLTAGKSYTFSPHINASMNIAGNLTSVGDCQNFIILRTYNGEPISINVGDVANSTIEYTYLQGWDNSLGATINTTNSIDGGNNTNWIFSTVGVGQTYYWRADMNNPTNYEGNWSDAVHWTTNPASLVGDGVCLPTLLDTVIYDAQSFSPTSNGSTISGYAFCKTLICSADIALRSSSTGKGILFIDESLHLDNNMTNYDFSGRMHFTGTGVINTNGTALLNKSTIFDKKGATWDLTNDIVFSSSKSHTYGQVYFYSGTFRTNDFDVSANIWSTGYSKAPTKWEFGTSTIEVRGATTWNSYIFGGTYMDSLQVDADSCILNIDNRHSNISAKVPYTYKMSSNRSSLIYPIHYKQVNFLDTDVQNKLYAHNVDFGFVNFSGDIRMMNDFSCDSVFIAGDHFYYMEKDMVLTLNAPHGKIITDARPGVFVNLETFQIGQTSYVHKPYGYAFCLDYIKVKNSEGTKNPLASVPTAFQAIHPLLKYETGANSDNINGTATGIWDFSLPVLVTPSISGDTLVEFCSFASNQLVPISLVGTSPYIISYSWVDNLGNTGSQADTLVSDDDNDESTPFIYYASIPASSALSTTYTIGLSTYRCGELTPAAPFTLTVKGIAPNVLVSVDRADSCILDNDVRWLTFIDDVDERPILSVQDQVNNLDVDSLGEVVIDVNFDATVQYLGVVPYLQRHWVLNPDNNKTANIRFYFTQLEFDSLMAHAVNPIFNTTTGIQVRKFVSGIIGVGPSIVIPHTVLPWTASLSTPFTTTAGIIAIEVNVNTLSAAYIIEPTNQMSLATEIVEFEALLNPKKEVALSWLTRDEIDLDYCVIERSKDGYNFEELNTLPALNNNRDNNQYSYLDKAPYTGVSYYRLRLVDTDGSIKYSAIKAVEVEGIELMKLFPIPANDYLNISLNSTNDGTINIQLIDQLGRMVTSLNRTVTTGQNSIEIPTRTLGSGMYILKLTDANNNTQQRKFVVQK